MTRGTGTGKARGTRTTGSPTAVPVQAPWGPAGSRTVVPAPDRGSPMADRAVQAGQADLEAAPAGTDLPRPAWPLLPAAPAVAMD